MGDPWRLLLLVVPHDRLILHPTQGSQKFFQQVMNDTAFAEPGPSGGFFGFGLCSQIL